MKNNINGLSVIVPFLNEEDAIPYFLETMEQYAAELSFPIEVVFVNDGSKDSSLKMIESCGFKSIKNLKIINLSKNYGAHAAVRAGILYAKYDICTWMGIDLQEPLEIIPISYEAITNGFEAVYFEKRTVKVSVVNRLFSKIYSHMIRRYAVNNYSSDGTATIAFGSKIKEYLNNNIERNSSLMLQIMNAGFEYKTVPLDYHERTAGKSKWTFSKKMKLFIDSFVSFSFMPIRLVSIVGILIFLLGLVIGAWTVINKIINPDVPVGYSTIACILALGFGITNISMGIIAEYLWRTYDASMNRPAFLVSDIIERVSDEENESI